VVKVHQTRKLVAIGASCAALVVGLAACGSSGGSSGGTSAGGDAPRLFMVSAPPGDDFYYTIEQSAKQEAARIGADLEVQQYPKYEASSQASVLNAGIARNPDAILIGPIDENALQATLQRAADRGIKVITYDTSTRDPEGVVSTYVSGDITELGRNAARAQVRLLGGRGKVFYQGTQPDNVFFDSLQGGWKEIMGAESGITQLPVVYSDWEASRASQQMQAILVGNPDLAGGFAGIYPDQQAIVPAVKRAGKLDQVKMVGVDGAPANVQRLRDGELQAIVSVKAAEYGVQAVDAAVKAIRGERLPAKTVIGQCVLTKDTLEDPANRDCLYAKASS
jgi:ribose transport system substrate-binding protein